MFHREHGKTRKMQVKYIGNIVTEYRKDKFSPLFNVVGEFPEADRSLPTIIIGLNEAKTYINDFCILKKGYEDGLIQWTYKKTERKYEYDNDIPAFYRFCLDRMLSNVGYRYLDFSKYRYNETKRILNWLDSETDKVCFLTMGSKFMFIYDTTRETVFGISLTLAEYIGVDRKKAVLRVKKNRKNRFIYDTRFLDSDIRSVIGANTHYIPVLSTFFQTS